MAAGSKRLGRAIYDHRLVVLGQTRDQVAATLGTSKTTVGRWEDAVVLPEPKAVPALTAWLGVTNREMGALLRDEAPIEEDPVTTQRLDELAVAVEALAARVEWLVQQVSGTGDGSSPPPAPRLARRQVVATRRPRSSH